MEQSSLMPLFITVVAFGAILGMFIFYRKKMGLGKWEKKLTIIDRIPIDKKNGLLLVKLEDTELLLGVSGAGINRLFETEVKKPIFTLVNNKVIPFPKQETQLRA